MKSSKNYVILLLALTTLGGMALGWHQYQELVGLRAAALDPNERSDLQKKLTALEKENRDLRDALAAAHGGQPGDGDDAMAAGDQAGGDDQNGRDRRDGRREVQQQRFAAIRELMAKPEVQAMMLSERKAGMDARYAPLFRSLNLSPDQADKLNQLLIDRENAQRDVAQAARDQGINPRSDPQGFQKLMADAESPINDNIKSLIGDNGLNQLASFDQTMPQRNVVNTLQQRLSNSDAPLTAAQADQMVQILAANAPAAGTTTPNGGGWRGGPDFGGRGGFGGANGLTGPNAAVITPTAVNQAQTVLSSNQMTALQKLQQQQQTAQQLQQMIRSAGGGNNPRRGGGGGG